MCKITQYTNNAITRTMVAMPIHGWIDSNMYIPSYTIIQTPTLNYTILIVKVKSLVSLSQEELESLNEALGERTNEEALTSAIVSK